MEYINQLQYPHMPYITDRDHPDSDFCRCGTIKRAGCGLCCACMLVDRLTLQRMTLEECRVLSRETGADHAPGTDMKLLGPALAQRYGLALCMTSDSAQLLTCLAQGGAAILNVGGDREGHTGTFSNGGHYILAVSAKGDEVCLLDPSWTPEKYTAPPRSQRVRQAGQWLYAPVAELEADTANRQPGYYLFTRLDVPTSQEAG